MRATHFFISFVTGFLLLSVSAVSEESTTIRLASTPALSPDGKKLAFEWAGDVWISRIRGGDARRITSHPAADGGPAFSPDGEKIAFTSNRTGSDQVFTMPVKGGIPRQVTFHSEGSRVVDWYPDGKSILIRAQRAFGTRSSYRYYRVALENREAEALLFDAEIGASGASLSPDGEKLLFTREGGDLYRRGYRGTRASQIWLAENLETENPKFTKLISRTTGARSPMWKPDGSGFFYLGDHGKSGLFSLWSRDMKSGKEKELAKAVDDPAILPAIARNGSAIVYRSGFDFVRIRPEAAGRAARPRPIPLRATGDVTDDNLFRRTLTKATNVSFSADGLEMAFAAGGDIWIMDTELKEPIPITSTAAEEREPVMSPDGKQVLFIRDDGTSTDIWSAERAAPKSYWWRNREFKETQLTKDGEKKHDLVFVPGGKKISYHVGAGDLWISDADGKNGRRLIESWRAMLYDWSPDGKWIAYAKNDSDFNRDIWIAPVDGKREPYNVSRHPDSDSNPKWSPDGKILAFTGRRFDDETDIYYVYLSRADEETDRRDRSLKSAVEKMTKERKNPTPPPAPKKEDPKPAPDKTQNSQAKSAPPTGKPPPNKVGPIPAKDEDTPPTPAKPAKKPEGANAKKAPASPRPKLPEVTIDFDGLYERIHRISIPDAKEENLFWSHDSKRLAFGAKIKNVDATYFVTFPDKLSTPSTLYSRRGSLARWIPKNDTVLWLVNGLPASLSKGSLRSYSFRALQTVDRRMYRETAFQQIWRTMGDIWYDPNLNNLDWNAIGEKYAPIAAVAPDNRNFDRAVAMMLGELNGSHLGFRSSSTAFGQSVWKPSSGWPETTAHPGVTFDRFFPGPGLKVETVVPFGPADQNDGKLKTGDVILEIDDVKVGPKTDLTQVLNGPLERMIRFRVHRGDEKEKKDGARTVTIRPKSYASIRSLMNQDTIRKSRALVDKLSGGKIGYVHVSRMHWNEFIKFEEEIYARGVGKDGLIIDVRNNGGGFTADHLLTVLTPAEHAFTIPRGGDRGYPQDRRVYATWNKPITVLCNQNSFSNAEIFSHAIKELDRGKLVGVETSGGVISTGSKTIMDVGTLRMPFRGWYRLSDGQDMELNGAKPDITIWPNAGELAKGKDRQIEKAVEVLKKDIAAFQKRPKPKPVRASER
ncbi:MAG: S41 family peptidase [Verrucomicrobiales bacterium]|nr:S41 family peptidase [Verrucomicrobiales bacterium]